MLLASFVPWLGNILFIAGIGPFSVLDPTPLAFAITGAAFLLGIIPSPIVGYNADCSGSNI